MMALVVLETVTIMEIILTETMTTEHTVTKHMTMALMKTEPTTTKLMIKEPMTTKPMKMALECQAQNLLLMKKVVTQRTKETGSRGEVISTKSLLIPIFDATFL